MAAESVTAVAGVPTMFAAWLGRPGFEAAFAGVRFAWSGSAAMRRSLVRAYGDRGVALFEGYGLTETAPVLTLNWSARRSDARVGRAGRTRCRVGAARLSRAASRDAATRARSSSGAPTCSRATGPTARTARTTRAGSRTGDLAVRDDDGNLRLVGRRTDLVIVNGFNVYPAEVECVLRSFDGIAEAAVVGVPDESSGEAVLAFVVPRAGSRTRRHDDQRRCRGPAGPVQVAAAHRDRRRNSRTRSPARS